MFPVLLSACDLRDGLTEYAYGAEARIVEEAGHRRKEQISLSLAEAREARQGVAS